MESIKLLIGLALITTNLYARSFDESGVMAVVCKDKVEILDIYEGRQKALKFPALTSFSEKKLAEYALKLAGKNNLTSDSFIYWVTELQKEYVLVSEIKSEANIPEFSTMLPDGCKLSQMTRFEDGKLLIDLDLFSKIDNFNKVAMVFHEALRRMEHRDYELDSRYVRELTARILDVRDNFDSNQRLIDYGLQFEFCESEDSETSFFIKKINLNTQLFQFSKLMGHTIHTRNFILLREVLSAPQVTTFTDLIMGSSQMILTKTLKGYSLSWEGHYPGESFNNVNVECSIFN